MRALALDPAAPKTTFDTTAAFELQSVVPLYLPQKLEVSTHLDAVSSRAPLVTRCALPHLVVSEGCSKRTVPCVEARAAAVHEKRSKTAAAAAARAALRHPRNNDSNSNIGGGSHGGIST